MTLLNDIINDAVNDSVSISVVLRKTLVLAHQLKNDTLKVWVERELNGYPDNDLLPDYRHLSITSHGSFIGPGGNVMNNQPLPASILPEPYRDWATDHYMNRPIANYVLGLDDKGTPQGGILPWPADMVALHQHDFVPSWVLIRAHQVIPGTAFVSLLDTVRTRVLQLALELQSELGTGIEDVTKIEPQVVEKSVVNYIYGGNNVFAETAANFSQIGSIVVNEGNFHELQSALAQLGLDQSAIDHLKQAMDEDAKLDGGKPTFGQRTKKWLTDAASYTSKQGLKVGFDVAKKYATKWVLQHYGIDPDA